MAEQRDVAKKYSSLLQPVQDFAENWNVDIATLLENYMRDLEQCDANAPPTQSNRPSLVNFAEAALIIQGSVQVYSKKVEYLYQLTYNLWDYLSKKSPKNRRSRSSECGSGSPEKAASKKSLTKPRRKDGDGNSNDLFLSLDDIKENNNVDLKESPSKKRRFKKPTLKLVRPMPLQLVPLEDFEKRDVPLMDKRGEPIGKKDDYRVNNSLLHSSGALLLDAANLCLVEDLADNVRITEKKSAERNNGGSIVTADPNKSSRGIVLTAPSPMSAFSDASVISPGMPVGGDDTLDLDHMPEPCFSPPPPSRTECGVSQTTSSARRQINLDLVEAENGSETSKVGDSRLKRKNDAPETNLDAQKRKIEDDALELLDEFEHADVPAFAEKPLRKGKTWRIPETLNLKQKGRKRKNGDSAPAQKLAENADNDNHRLPKETLAEFLKATARNNRRSKYPRNPLNVVAHAELDDLCHNEMERRRQLRMKRVVAETAVRGPSKENLPNTRTGHDLNADQDNGGNDNLLDESQIDRNLAAIFEGDDDDEGDDNAGNTEQNGENHLLNQPETLPPTAASSETHYSPPIEEFATYEDLMKHKVEEYMLKAQKSLGVSESIQRVQEWEEKVRPLLDEEESRRTFDVNVYSDEILRHFEQSDNDNIFFRDFTADKEKWETSRYFLASLMLANQGNVEIGQEGILDEAINTMQLKFLNAECHYKQVEEYIAPSSDVAPQAIE